MKEKEDWKFWHNLLKIQLKVTFPDDHTDGWQSVIAPCHSLNKKSEELFYYLSNAQSIIDSYIKKEQKNWYKYYKEPLKKHFSHSFLPFDSFRLISRLFLNQFPSFFVPIIYFEPFPITPSKMRKIWSDSSQSNSFRFLLTPQNGVSLIKNSNFFF